MNRHEANALREQRAKAHHYMSGLLLKEQTPEVRSSVDKVLNDIEAFTNQINKLENPGNYTSINYLSTPEERNHNVAFERWIRGGMDVLTVEQRSLMQSRRETRDGLQEGSQLAHLGTYTNLGYFVPTGFTAAVEQAKKMYCSFDQIAQVIRTGQGNVIPFPISNDTSNSAAVIGEASAVSEQDVTAGHIPVSAYKLNSGLVKVSSELMQDSAIDLSAWLADRFAERFGRGEENYFTNGTGPTGSPAQPTDILTAIAASGATPVVAAGSAANDGSSATGANSIGYADLVNLEHAVDPAYRQRAKYMLHDNTVGTIKKILDKYGRPLWAPGITIGEPDTINGYPYFVNQAMPQVAASNTTIIFGDFSKFLIRRVKDMSVKWLVELYAANDEVGFLAFERVDSALLDAGTHPLNVLQQHS